MPNIDPMKLAARYRREAIDLDQRRILVTNFRGTQQESDLSEPANCSGYGRVRHFKRNRSTKWLENPLPLDPALKALSCVGGQDEIRAQVFQNAVCNWRCWYCFVPFTLLDANKAHSKMMSAGDLCELWLQELNRPSMIDLTGGQPELVPEWILWMMQELRRRGLDQDVYLWSDDNLSADYFWTELSPADREFITSYPMYSRVCCFKGFDEESFAFNTSVRPEQFDLQFARMRKLLELGLDLYAYVTLTAVNVSDIQDRINHFVDRLQTLHEYLPLRTVPLQIEAFTPTATRLNDERRIALENQFRALEAWTSSLQERFPSALRSRRIVDVPLARSAVHAF